MALYDFFERRWYLQSTFKNFFWVNVQDNIEEEAIIMSKQGSFGC